MPFPPPLPDALTRAVLSRLGVPVPRHDVAWLDTLVQAYGQRVPWESASRIARLATGSRDAAPRLPVAFWHGVLRDGTGGTCFESNFALSALLARIGFDGTLTINDMGETRACHTALTLTLADQRYVVDVGYPIYAALPIGPAPTSRDTPWFRYEVIPTSTDVYRIENHPHPEPYLFDLHDRTIPAHDYVDALRADYGPGGLFLDRVVVRRIVDGNVWRFASHDVPWRLARFRDGRRDEHLLPTTLPEAAAALAAHFGLPADIVSTALGTVTAAGAEQSDPP